MPWQSLRRAFFSELTQEPDLVFLPSRLGFDFMELPQRRHDLMEKKTTLHTTLTKLRRIRTWALFLCLTLVVLGICELVRLPAAPLLAGIAAGSVFALRNADLEVSKPLFSLSQCLLGLRISLSFNLDVLHGMLEHWLLILIIVVAVVVFGLIGGLVLTLKQWLPGTTGIWGTSPGGATPMVIMSEAYGGDIRLVAVMQYLRVIIVSLVAVLVARFLGAVSPAVMPSYWEILFPAIDYINFALTLVVALLCCGLARLSRIPSASFLLPMFVGAVFHNTGMMDIELPGWLLIIAFTVIGWSIGLRFNRAVFAYALKAMPKILGAIFFMIGCAAILAIVLIINFDVDPLTAYLATSPGGVDAVAIIAASSGGDMAFIMATQTLRLILVLLAGPYLAKNVARIVRKRLPSVKEI